MVVFEYGLGGTIVIALDAESVDPGVVAVSAAMKRLNHDRRGFRDDAPSIPMTITARPAAGGFPAGWHVVLSAEASALLEPGFYGATAWFSLGGGTFATETLRILVSRTAST